MYQAGIVIRDILGRAGPPANYYRASARVTFTDPEVRSVGLTEHAARHGGVDIHAGTTSIPSTARGWIHKTGTEGLIKFVEDSARGVLIGATVMGPAPRKVLGALALAVHAEVPTGTLRSMIYAYPTFHRGIEDALRTLT